jgi:hypothetical protein
MLMRGARGGRALIDIEPHTVVLGSIIVPPDGLRARIIHGFTTNKQAALTDFLSGKC